MKTNLKLRRGLTLSALFCFAALRAQELDERKQALSRLDRLEEQSQLIIEEIRALRKELAATPPKPAEEIQEKLEVQANRIDEQAQTKVEGTQRFPLRVTGMALFNTFWNGRSNGGAENPVVASLNSGSQLAGATLRQSVLGLTYQGPRTFAGGNVSGSLYLDLFGGSTNSLDHLLRLRVATIRLDWRDQSISVGQDKPIISPREPNSLAQVGVSPLTGAGNLWLWEPQVRFEQRFHFGENWGLRAEAGLFQTSEGSANIAAEYASSLTRSRPGIEGRFELWHRWGEGRKIEIAPGFHYSRTHVAGTTVPSTIASVDWLIKPWSRVELTGMFFSGQNVANLGALRQGFTIFENGLVIPIHSRGGWAQFRFLAGERLSFNLYGGQEDDRRSDLLAGGIGKNQNYAANVMYRLAPNVIVSFESGRVNTSYVSLGNRFNLHHDLALAYLF